MPVQNLTIITKKHQPAAWEAGQGLRDWCQQRGLKVSLVENEPDPHVPALAPDTRLIVVMGGDGTLLSVARHYGHLDIPVLGVNVGGLGFLTEVSQEELYPALEQVLAGAYEAEERLMLSVSLWREGNLLWHEHALNDAVINKGALARIVKITTCIDGEYLTTYRADGLIVSTPTGSTAYTMSAGGPIAYPTLRHLIVLPICPHTLSNRPLILPATSAVTMGLDDRVRDTYLTVDGQVGQALQEGDRVEVKAAAHHLKFIKSPRRSYFEILRTKLGWGEVAGPRPEVEG